MVTRVIDTVTGLFGGGGTEIIGDGDARVMVSSNAKAETKDCTAQQMINDKRCGDRKVVVVDAARMPFIARNISLAWGEGHKFLLTRDASESNRDARCDEFEFASTQEGGDGARTEEVPRREQNCQGGTLSTTYRYVPINDGEQFMVVISNPDMFASEPYKGVDTARDQSCGI